jgi:hypothetical protein
MAASISSRHKAGLLDGSGIHPDRFSECVLSLTLKAFPLDSKSRFVMIYRGGKSF